MPDPRDEMLRDMAAHRGLRLVRSRRRKPGGDFGRYGLTDIKTGQDCFGIGKDGLEATADEIEDYLRRGAVADWKRSLGLAGKAAADAKPKPKKREEPEPEPPRGSASASLSLSLSLKPLSLSPSLNPSRSRSPNPNSSSAKPRGSTGRRMPRSTISARRRRIGSASSFSSSSAIRSRDSAIRSLARAVQASSAGVRVGRPAEARVEAEEAQDAQMILGDAGQRIADEADPARLEVGQAAEIVEHLAAAGSADSALMVKSRRAASSRQSSVKATVARRPSVETSRRKRGDLDRAAAHHGRDRAVGEAGRHRLDPARARRRSITSPARAGWRGRRR
jgi:hypothetical protein